MRWSFALTTRILDVYANLCYVLTPGTALQSDGQGGPKPNVGEVLLKNMSSVRHTLSLHKREIREH